MFEAVGSIPETGGKNENETKRERERPSSMTVVLGAVWGWLVSGGPTASGAVSLSSNGS